MAQYSGTIIGADGRRYPVGGTVPNKAEDQHRTVIPVFGPPQDGQGPVWSGTKERLVWGASGGGGTDTDARLDAIETAAVTSTTVDTIVKLTQAAYNALAPPNPTTLYVIVG